MLVIQYEVRSKSIRLYFFTPKLRSHAQNSVVGRWKFSRRFPAVTPSVQRSRCIFVLTQDDRTHRVEILHQILSNTWWYSSSHHSEDSASLWWWCYRKTEIKQSYNCFRHGRTSMDSESRSGRPPTKRKKELIEKVQWIVMKYRPVTIQETAYEVGICTRTVHSILMQDLRMRTVSAKCDRSFHPL